MLRLIRKFFPRCISLHIRLRVFLFIVQDLDSVCLLLLFFKLRSAEGHLDASVLCPAVVKLISLCIIKGDIKGHSFDQLFALFCFPCVLRYGYLLYLRLRSIRQYTLFCCKGNCDAVYGLLIGEGRLLFFRKSYFYLRSLHDILRLVGILVFCFLYRLQYISGHGNRIQLISLVYSYRKLQGFTGLYRPVSCYLGSLFRFYLIGYLKGLLFFLRNIRSCSSVSSGCSGIGRTVSGRRNLRTVWFRVLGCVTVRGYGLSHFCAGLSAVPRHSACQYAGGLACHDHCHCQ